MALARIDEALAAQRATLAYFSFVANDETYESSRARVMHRLNSIVQELHDLDADHARAPAKIAYYREKVSELERARTTVADPRSSKLAKLLRDLRTMQKRLEAKEND